MKSSGNHLILVICSMLVTMFIFSCNSKNEKKQVTSDPPVPTAINRIPETDPAELEALISKDSLNTDLRLRLAALYYERRELEKAVYHNEVVLKIDEGNPASLFNLGNLCYDLERNESAVDYYTKFLEYDPKNTNVRCDLATCWMRLNKYDKAIDLLRENIRIDPEHLQSHHNLSVVLKQTGRLKEAELELQIFNEILSKMKKQERN